MTVGLGSGSGDKSGRGFFSVGLAGGGFGGVLLVEAEGKTSLALEIERAGKGGWRVGLSDPATP